MKSIRCVVVFAALALSVHDTMADPAVEFRCAVEVLSGYGYDNCMKKVNEVGAYHTNQDSSINPFTYCCTVKVLKDCMVTVAEETCGKLSMITEEAINLRVDERISFFFLDKFVGRKEKRVCSRYGDKFSSESPLCWPTWGLAGLLLLDGMVLPVSGCLVGFLCYKRLLAKTPAAVYLKF